MAKFSLTLEQPQADRLIAYIAAKADNKKITPEDFLGAIRVVGVAMAVNMRATLEASFFADLTADEKNPDAPLFRWDGQMTKGRYVQVQKKNAEGFLVTGDFGRREEDGETFDLSHSKFIFKAIEYASTGVRHMPVSVGLTEGEQVNAINVSIDGDFCAADEFVDVREDNPA
jgi:hypothetical protein